MARPAGLAGTGEPCGRAARGDAISRSRDRSRHGATRMNASARCWVVAHGIIPQTHRKGHEQSATPRLIGGFVVMMLLDTAPG